MRLLGILAVVVLCGRCSVGGDKTTVGETRVDQVKLTLLDAILDDQLHEERLDEAINILADLNKTPTEKRNPVFRFGKRGTIFRFGKRGSVLRSGIKRSGNLFRYGKKKSGNLFRYGKKRSGNLFRYGKRSSGVLEDENRFSDTFQKSPGVFRYGKRSPGIFRYGKRSPGIFRYGKRFPGIFRYGKRSPNIFRYGKRQSPNKMGANNIAQDKGDYYDAAALPSDELLDLLRPFRDLKPHTPYRYGREEYLNQHNGVTKYPTF